MIEVYKISPPERNRTQDDTQQCTHNFVIAKTKTRSGICQYRQLCLKCGAVGHGGTAIPHRELTEKQKAEAVDYELRERILDEQREIVKAKWREDDADFNKRWWQWYNGYMQSDVWQRRRQQVLRRARGICEACQVAAATEVHHLNYNHVGREPLFDLVAVCEQCHQQLHASRSPFSHNSTIGGRNEL